MALTKRGVPCLAYHAGLKDADRSQVQEDWMDGKVVGLEVFMIIQVSDFSGGSHNGDNQLWYGC